MKRYLKIMTVIIIFMFLGGICVRIYTDNETKSKVKKTVENMIKKEDKKILKNNYPSYNGYLKVNGTKLVNEYDEDFVLKGVSSHGIQWFYDLYNKDNFKLLKEEWNTNVFRVAMYTKENGYIDDKTIKEKVKTIVDSLIDMDMYVIIDWHILSDNNPLIYKEEAKKFFDEMSNLYKDKPNVIYEICNEPNNGTTNDDVKKYASEIIPVIRNNSPKSLIIIGTSNWSQDVDTVDKLNYENIMYALHFYSGTHKDDLRNKARTALNNNIPIFVSEFGVSDASGSGGIYFDETNKWVEFLKENKISLISWSLTNKNESSAILKENTNTVKDENLTSTGKYLKELFINY